MKFQAIFMSWIVPLFSIGNLGSIKILYLAMHVVTYLFLCNFTSLVNYLNMLLNIQGRLNINQIMQAIECSREQKFASLARVLRMTTRIAYE